MKVWDLSRLKRRTLFSQDIGFNWLPALAVSPDNKHVAVRGRDGSIVIWDTLTGDHRQLPGHTGIVVGSIGKENLVGSSKYFDGGSITNPAKAPCVFLQLSAGDLTYLPAGTTVTFQGIIVDLGSSSAKRGMFACASSG